jgi:transcriptional regulator with XRE-family HTH domain
MEAPSKLRQWRDGQKLTLKAAGKLVGVEHSTWSEWESGSRKPSLERAIDIELETKGEVPLESWGFPPEVAARMRTLAHRRSRRRPPLPATGTEG